MTALVSYEVSLQATRMHVNFSFPSLTLYYMSISGELFAQCPVENPQIDVEAVMDSSRYFVLRIKDGSGRCNY